MSPKTAGFVMPADEELEAALANTDAGLDVAELGEVETEATSTPEAPTAPPQTETKTQPVKTKEKINLQDHPQWREAQATYDRRIAAEQKRAADAEARVRQIEEQAQMAQAVALQAQLGEIDPEQARIMQSMSALDTQRQLKQIREWEAYKAQRIRDEGFEPNDPLFQKDYRGMEGTFQFDADLSKASRDKAKRELEEARRATSPESIAKLVERQVARALAGKGYDANDLGTPGSSVDSDATYTADLRKLQSGAMSPAKFAKKWGEQE